MASSRPDISGPGHLWELALLFLRLGCTAYGGPAAHIAMIEQEVVRKRRWLSHEEFLDLLGAVNLIPGPNSTEMVIHIGLRRAGLAGLVVAGVCFILPAAVAAAALAWMYQRHGTLPAINGVLDGIKPVILAIVMHAVWPLLKAALKSTMTVLLALALLGLQLLGANELGLLLGAGVLMASMLQLKRQEGLSGLLPCLAANDNPVSPFLTALNSGALPGFPPGVVALFTSFLKIGSILYGSGYVLLAYLRSEFVVQHSWLTDRQLLDAVAVGQFTPGPVLTTATFIGYLLRGPAGAVAATVGIFLPAFVFVALSSKLIPRIRRSATASAFLDGVNLASLVLMISASLQLVQAALVNWWTVTLFIAAALVLRLAPINSAWLVIAGGILGWLMLP